MVKLPEAYGYSLKSDVSSEKLILIIPYGISGGQASWITGSEFAQLFLTFVTTNLLARTIP